MQQRFYAKKRAKNKSHIYETFTLNEKQHKMPGGENDVPTAISDQHILYFTKYCTSDWSETRALLKKSYRIGLARSDRNFPPKKENDWLNTVWRKEKNIHHFAAVIARRYHMYAYKFGINKYLFSSMPHLPQFVLSVCVCVCACSVYIDTTVINLFSCIHCSCIFFALFFQYTAKRKESLEQKQDTNHA